MFQLILPFQLELPFDAPETARGATTGARVRRARVRGGKGRALPEMTEASMQTTAEALGHVR